MQLVEAFVRNPVKVAVGVLLVALFGFISLFRMPMQLTPEVQIPTISVETRWPGASPQEVEREIIQEQEEQLKSVEGMTKMTAECANSVGTITLEFKVGTDISEALLKVNTRLQQVPEYPEDADEPIISSSSTSDSPIAWFILRPWVATSEQIAQFQQEHPELAELLEPARRAEQPGLTTRRLQQLVAEHPELEPELQEILPKDIEVPKLRRFVEDYVEAAFERVPGVANSNVFGGREDELQVVVDPHQLAARQLTIMDVRRVLRQQNNDVSGGDLWEGKRRYVIRTMGQFRSPERVANVILARRDGSPVYVRDVAEVRLAHKKPTGLVKNFGTFCIAVNCVRETGANVLDTMAGLREVRAQLNRDLLNPRGLDLIQVYDETEYIYSAIGLVNQNIVVGGLLTVAVLLLFLRSGRSTLVIALAIPTSLIGTFLMLDLMGRSLNVISLAGLAFAVGMLVDNAVVVLENIYRHYQSGDPPVRAAVRGTHEVWGAVVASTLTTLAVFLPVLFVQEEAGQLFRDIALAISSAVGLSLIVSVTLIPTAAARLLRKGKFSPRDEADVGPSFSGNGEEQNEDAGAPAGPSAAARRAGNSREPRGRVGRAWKGALGLADSLGSRFVEHVVWVNATLQRHIFLRLGAVAVFVFGALIMAYLLMPKVEYLPSGNRNLVFGVLLPPPGYNIDRLMELGGSLEQKIKPYWNVNRDDPENAKLDFPPIDDFFFVAAGRRVFFGLRAIEPLRAGELVGLVQKVSTDVPGTFAVANQASLFGRNLSTGRTIDVEISGPGLPKLVRLGGMVMGQTQAVVPGARAFPKPSLDLSSPELHVMPKWEQAADLGMDAASLGYTVDALVDGAYATDYFIGGDKIDLTIVGQDRFAKHTQDLEQLSISTPTGDLVPLGAVADVELEGGPEQINHRERQRAITIEVTPPLAVPLQQAMDDIESKIVEPLRERGEIGAEYQIRLAGTADKLRETWRALRFNVVLALLITYLLMAALFESWLYPLVIILSVPLGAVGGFLGLWLLNLYLPLQNYFGVAGATVQSLDVLTMLGFVILIGTVVNNAILIVHQSLNHMREEDMEPDQAILASVRTRIRPIFMTTATTVLGLSPLVFFPGAGSELYRGLGAVVLGGLIVSTVFTLVLVPTLFSLMMQAKSLLASWLGWQEEPPPKPPGESAERPEAVTA
jgi:HAE1 family hydrophobic/amphiphilic exporter-1